MASHHQIPHDHGEGWSLLAALIDRPKTRDELIDDVRLLARRVGIFSDPSELRRANGSGIEQFLSDTLSVLLRKGWIESKEGRYHLTESGRSEAETMLADLERSKHVFERVTKPTTVSMATMVVHFVLASVKLPAAVLSGSVGLLNDSLDTLLDGVASVIVYFGFRTHRERMAGVILVCFMIATGGYAMYEAILRIVRPYPTSSDPIAYIAVVISALVCVGLWVYQKLSGVRNSSMTLLAQSVDSRNHVLVAVGVSVGLIANRLGAPIVDRLVGLGVAVLILKSGVELLFELICARDSAEDSLARYGFPGLARFRSRQFTKWLVHLVSSGEVQSRDELESKARGALDFSSIRPLEAVGAHRPHWAEHLVSTAMNEVFAEGYLQGEPIEVTDRGRRHLGSIGFIESLVLGASTRNRFLDILVASYHALGALISFSLVYAFTRWLIERLPSRFDVLDLGATGPPIVSFLWLDLTGPQIGYLVIGALLSVVAGFLRRSARHSTGRRGASDRPFASDRSRGRSHGRRRPPIQASVFGAFGWGIGIHSYWGIGLATVASIVMIAHRRPISEPSAEVPPGSDQPGLSGRASRVFSSPGLLTAVAAVVLSVGVDVVLRLV